MHVRYQPARILLGLLLLALAPFQVAHAQFRNVQGSSGWSIDWNGGYIQPTPQWMPAYPATAGNAGYGIDNGTLVGKSTGRLPIGSAGAVIDVSAKVIPTSRAIGDALGRFAGRLALPLSLLSLASELNYILTKQPDGSTTFQETVQLGTYTYACQYGTASGGQGCVDNWVAAQKSFGYPTCGVSSWSWGPPTATFNGVVYNRGIATVISGSCANSSSPGTRTQTSTYSETQSRTAQNFADSIALKSGWPTSSALPSAVADALKGGESIGSAVPSLTGPASVNGPTSTTTGPNGTVTKTDVYNITYNNNNITYNTVTTTNDNGVITTQTKTSDTPQTDCDKYPDTAGCAKLDTPASDTLNKKTQAVTVTAVTFATSSLCPAPIAFTIRGASYAVSYQPMCDRLALLKTLFLALAGVLAAYIVADSFRV